MIAHTVAKSLLWAIATAVATALAIEAFVVAVAIVGSLFNEMSLSKWIAYTYHATFTQLILTVEFQFPLVLLMTGIWIGLVRRQPSLDRTRRGFLLGCLIVIMPATLFIWMLAAGGNIFDATRMLATPVIATALLTLVFNYLGALLPRFIVPGLKQGQLVPPTSEVLRST